MPVVTKIEQQKKRQDRYSIYLDDKYAFGLSANDLVSSGLHLRQELSEDEAVKYEQISSDSKLMERVYNFLSYRQRTQSEVENYLRRKECDEHLAAKIIDKLMAQGMISDSQFARDWVSTRQVLKPRSKRRLELELRQKGVDRELISQTLEAIGPEEEVEAACQIAKKKLTQAKYQDQSKLIAYLMTQGFSYDACKRAVEQ